MTVVHMKPTGKSRIRAVHGGFLEVYSSRLGELPVAHVSGTPEQMGRQYGALVGDMIQRSAERFKNLFVDQALSEGLLYRILDNAWTHLERHTPVRYLREMAAVAEGACEAGFDVSVEDLQRITTLTNFDLYKREERMAEFLGEGDAPTLAQYRAPQPMSCTMFAVWGTRTVDGKMFAHRDLDWVSQTGMHEDRLVTVYRPEGGHAFVTMAYAGVIGPLAGMNEKGICFSEVGAFSMREELDGTPWTLLARRVLEESACFEDAVAIVQDAKHTIGYNYLVAHGDPARFGRDTFAPNAAAFETNFECCETFYEDDPKEHDARWVDDDGHAIHYGLPLREAIMRGDMAFGERTRALQAADNGPGDPANDGNPVKPVFGNTYLDCHKPMHDMIRAYETGAEYVFPLRGAKVIDAGAPRKIGHEEALTIAATVAHNEEKLCDNDWDVMSVVYAPTDLEFWVGYESCDEHGRWKNAPDSGYWHFDLMALINSERE